MEAKELRIGNYIKDTKRNRLVQYHSIESSWNFIWVNYKEGSGIYKLNLENKSLQNECQIKPIPLTEEILLKCGVVRVYGSTFSLNDRYNDNSETCTEKFVLECFNFEENNQLKLHYTGDEGIKLSSHIKYIHQLQNLHFMLTGKELEINL